MVLCYKYKLKPSSSQKILLDSHFFAFNQAWNITLSAHIKQREDNNLIAQERTDLSERKQDCSDYIESDCLRSNQVIKAIYLSNTDLDKEIKRILKNREIPYNSKIVQQARMLCNQAIQTNYKNQKKRIDKDSKAKYSDVSYRVSSAPRQVIETTKEQYSIVDNGKLGI